MRTTSKIVLEKTIVVQLLGDEGFYRACPLFLWLKDSGLAAVAQYNEQLQPGTTCRGCGGPQVVDGVVEGLIRNIKQHFDNDPTTLECLKDYIGSRRGKRPLKIEMHYKSGSGAKRIVF